MKTVSDDLKTHLAGEVTTVATCWRVVRSDGREYFFTDHDVDLTVDGDAYEADSGMLPSSVTHSRGAAVDNMEAFSFLDSDKISEFDLQAGLFNNAVVDVFIVNYIDLAMGKLYIVQGGIIGEVTVRDNTFTAEVRGKTQRFAQKTIDLYGPVCRAKLGDAQCGVDLDDSPGTYRHDGSVTSIDSGDDRRTFVDDTTIQIGAVSDSPSGASSAPEGEHLYAYGVLTWATSASGNDGLLMEVKRFDPITGTFELFQAMPYSIEIGDTFEVTYGCDKRKGTCVERFDNIVNFRAEPFIPGSVVVPPRSEEGRKATRRGQLRPT